MVYKKSIRVKRQSRRRSLKRKNVKSRKVLRGGDRMNDIRKCNAQAGFQAPESPNKTRIKGVASRNGIIPDGLMCQKLVDSNIQF